MKTLLHSTAVLTLASTQIAVAHPGHHEGMSAHALMEHFWHSPFHSLPIALAAVVLGAAIYVGRKMKLNTRDKHSGS